jgi:hypothetical protein
VEKKRNENESKDTREKKGSRPNQLQVLTTPTQQSDPPRQQTVPVVAKKHIE